MKTKTQAAYRHLLYVAMLTIRSNCRSRGKESRNPFEWQRQYRRSRVTGAIADWLHNLADFSVRDFQGFDEAQFWEEHAALCKRFKGAGLESYRDVFESRINEETSD